MPGLYIPLRASSSSSSSSSSTSRPTGAPAVAPPPASFSRHRQAAPTAPPRSVLPAFHTSAKRAWGAGTSTQTVYPKGMAIPEEIDHGSSSLNYSSSGSLHLHDPSSVCLAAMVHEFLEEDGIEEEEQQKVSLGGASTCGRARCNCVDGVCGAEAGEAGEDLDDDTTSDRTVEQLREILQGNSSYMSSVLLKEVSKAMEELWLLTEYNGDARSNFLGRAVMMRLREAGYNAAACKSRWNHGDGLPAGDYEYIDVIMDGKEGKEGRMIVDIKFKVQFEIARPSSEYVQMLNVVPKVYVGRAEKIKQIVKIMSHAAKRSLRAQGLMMPPWRRHKYMQAKWLSPVYRRTTNLEPARHTYRNTQHANKVVASNAQGAKGFHLEDASKNVVNPKLAVAAKFLAADSKAAATRHEEKWQLPSLKEKPHIGAPLISALSFALQEIIA